MAAIAKSGTPSISTLAPPNTCRRGSGLIAGEDLGAGDACYIKSDGKVWRSTGAAANAAAQVDGYAEADVKSGRPVQLYEGVDWNYGSGMTPGTKVFLSGTTPGGIDTVASTGGTGQIGRASCRERV